MPRNLPDQALRLHTLIAMHPLETVRGRIQDELCQGKEEDMRDHEVLWDGCPPKLKGHLAFFEAEVQPSSRSYTQGLRTQLWGIARDRKHITEPECVDDAILRERERVRPKHQAVVAVIADKLIAHHYTAGKFRGVDHRIGEISSSTARRAIVIDAGLLDQSIDISMRSAHEARLNELRDVLAQVLQKAS